MVVQTCYLDLATDAIAAVGAKVVIVSLVAAVSIIVDVDSVDTLTFPLVPNFDLASSIVRNSAIIK
jgi:hypothetical protein